MERCGTSVQGNITQPALAQMAEIVALTKALQLSEGNSANIPVKQKEQLEELIQAAQGKWQ